MKIEQGRVASPGIWTIDALATALSVSIDELVQSSKHKGLTSTGYEGLTVEQVMARLRQDAVSWVADIRMTPLSRKPGLSKTRLAGRLQEEGIGYTHFRALGNPKENRPRFAGRDLGRGRAEYRLLLEKDDAKHALQQLRDLSREQRVALLCFEADERRCHRAVVLEALCTQAG